MKRRADTDVLVLGAHGRSFRHVFDGAQKQLRAVFGMEMVELPVRDKTTLSVEEQRKGECLQRVPRLYLRGCR